MSTLEAIRPILRSTYGKGGMVDALAEHLAEKIDAWDRGEKVQPSYADDRENMVRLTCWDWFSGGTTAAGVASRIEAALEAGQSEHVVDRTAR